MEDEKVKEKLQCPVCKMTSEVCKLLVNKEEDKAVCEELTKKVSAGEITIDEYFKTLHEKLKIKEEDIVKKLNELL